MRLLFIFFAAILFTGCSAYTPKDIHPITNFKYSQYLGTWHEIARLDFYYEKGLSKVTANYSLRDDGGIKVVNKGLDATRNKWNESVGVAYFTSSPDIASLKVSFFRPFYAGYNVIKIDKNYTVALVAGGSKDYLWILSRTPNMSKKVLDEYIKFAKEKGFDTDKLIIAK